ncbi:MAG: hypothetical protein WA979_12120 [Pacificimonas sp.]
MPLPSPRIIAAALLVTLSACDGAAAEALPVLVPTYEMLADGTTTLKGWRAAPADWSKNRIVIDHPAYKAAIVLSVNAMPVGFTNGLSAALAKEGLRDVRLTAKQDLTGDLTTTFSESIDNPGGRYAAFNAMATGRRGPVKVAGFWLQTPQGDEAGSSYEMFIAAPDEYEALGGWFVPAARYFQLSLTDPKPATIRGFGQYGDEDAAKNLASQFGNFMREILAGKTLAGMAQQQTLSIQQGLDQIDGRGLQDPMYDPAQ